MPLAKSQRKISKIIPCASRAVSIAARRGRMQHGRPICSMRSPQCSRGVRVQERRTEPEPSGYRRFMVACLAEDFVHGTRANKRTLDTDRSRSRRKMGSVRAPRTPTRRTQSRAASRGDARRPSVSSRWPASAAKSINQRKWRSVAEKAVFRHPLQQYRARALWAEVQGIT